MVKKIVFENEIVLYWEKAWELPERARYRIIVNNVVRGITDMTHFSIENVRPKTVYDLLVERLDARGYAVETLLSERVITPRARKKIDVTQAPYFAVGDGKQLNTKVIQRAIDDCKAGETVYFPQGIYLTGALKLHSNMELYIDKGATVQGTSCVQDYLPKIKSRFEGLTQQCYSSLLNMGELDENNYGFSCKNVVIRGGGAILGGGKALLDAVVVVERENLREYMDNNPEYVETCDKPDIIPARARPRVINMSNCRNVVIGNLTIGNGAAWNVHFVYSKDIVTYGCHIVSKGVWNGDGWNPDSSEDCTIFNTQLDTHDDAIAIKSGKNPEGNIVNRPTKNVWVFDCHGTRGVAIGSELSGGIENVSIWDCCLNVGGGLNIKTSRKRGGYVRNVKAKDCVFAHIRIRTDYNCNKDGESANELTKIEYIHLENVESLGTSTAYYTFNKVSDHALRIVGFPEKEYHIKYVNLKNLKLHVPCGEEQNKVDIQYVTDLKQENVVYV